MPGRRKQGDKTSVRSEVRAWRAVVTAKVEAEVGRGEVGAT